jgi:hypothetical protein
MNEIETAQADYRDLNRGAAYVSFADNLHLRYGDLLIADASENAINAIIA